MSAKSLMRVAGLLAILVASGSASADEQVTTLADSGEWAAVAHRGSVVGAPDVCIAGNMAQGFLFRTSSEEFEVRVYNVNWSLPANVSGSIAIRAGAWAKDISITGNTDNMVTAQMVQTDLIDLLSAMDKLSTLSVSVGKAKPIAVSLAGSARVTNAFRTCAGIPGNSAMPGSNPFQ
jgi:hypothetical protein